jgi:hypothetical protein
MVGEYVTSCCLYSAHKLCQITWHSGLLAQLEEHIIVGICCLSQHFNLSEHVIYKTQRILNSDAAQLQK